VLDGIKWFAEVQGNDGDKLIGSKEVGDSVQDGNEGSCGRSFRVKGELISK